ncbi:AAA family ATPase [Bacillus thuringiensis]|uniref:AAA family ATPase n=1 Tax=Bacillus thuringiensis TaxID=1428 RepID=UPI000BFD01B0|nr:AAA family ATPase [Bacillus thuringiensis]PGT90074.1 hypothetical protein COD17_10010 [Bacillus thuringiensis]
MAVFGVVAGKRTGVLVDKLTKGNSTLDFKGKWETTVDLKNTILRGGGMSLSNYKAVIVLDYGFRDSMSSQKMAEDFVAVQDVFQSQAIQGTKLYLLTQNSDLYRMLDGSINGVSGTYYDDVEILISSQGLPPKMIVDTLQGAHDRKGLYNKLAERKSREERLDKESEEFIESARSVSQEVLQYGVDKPVSDLSDKDYIDSAQNKRQIEAEKQIAEEKRKMEERHQKEAERLSQRGEKKLEQVQSKKNPALNRVGLSEEDKEFLQKDNAPQEVEDIKIPVVTLTKDEPTQTPTHRPVQLTKDESEEVGVTIKVSANDVRTDVPSAEHLQALFQESVRGDLYISDDKLATDKGIISVIGTDNSGSSGLVANMADMYAGVGRKVLVVDLDLVKRTQTRYFKQYERAVREHKGVSNSLLKVAQGGQIKSTSVSVTSRVDVLSISRNDSVEEVWATTVGAELTTIMEDAKHEYDIILLDIPFRHFHYYVRSMGIVDANVFVIENTLLAIEDFFAMSLTKYVQKDKLLMGDFITRSAIVLNKYIRGRRDEDGYELTGRKVKAMLSKAGKPYDNMSVAGEIPYYEDWEEQFFTGVRYIWKDDVAHSVLKGVCTKLVV